MLAELIDWNRLVELLVVFIEARSDETLYRAAFLSLFVHHAQHRFHDFADFFALAGVQTVLR